MQLYIAGIHTDTGKTHVSAAICASFNYDYFKLIQAGTPKDSETIKLYSPNTHIFQEGVFLQTAASPHIGKLNENISYNALHLTLPQSKNLVIEFAGGLLSPLDEQSCVIDYIQKYPLPTILVGKYYIGAINHTLLSLEILKQRNISPLCLVMCGDTNNQIDTFITQYSNITIIHLDFFDRNNFSKKIQSFQRKMQPIINPL